MLLERNSKEKITTPTSIRWKYWFNHPENIERTITAALNGSAHPFCLEINYLIMPL